MKRNRLGKRHWKQVQSDGVIQTTTVFQPHENKLYVETIQPNRGHVLKQNERLRNHLRSGKVVRAARIPEEDFSNVVKRYPDLIRGSPEERQQALTRIMREHPEYVVVKFVPKYHCA